MFGYPKKALLLFAAASLVFSATAEPLHYNHDIRPILSENCFYCHGQDANKRQADLRLDVREEAVQTGAIVPKDAAASTVIQRIHDTDPDSQMPPPKSNRRLSPEQKKLLERWIAEGAAYSPHWAFVAPQRPALPAVKREDWIRNPIDAAISWAIYTGQSLRQTLAYYNDYHSVLVPHRHALFFVTFEDVTRDFGKVTASFNERWNSQFVPFEHTPENVARCMAQIETEYVDDKGAVIENKVPRPSAHRARFAPWA